MIPAGSSFWLRLISTLIAAGTVVLASGSSVPITDVCPPLPPSQPTSSQRVDTLRSVSRHIFRLTNQERTQRGLNALSTEDQLRQIACEHTLDMLNRDFVRHENPDGEGPADRVVKRHRSLIGEAGENLWGQTGREAVDPTALAAQIVEKWMGSPPHRKNILRYRFSHSGVCTLRRGKRVRGTQLFADVRAYLRDPLPRTAPAGNPIVARIEKTFPRDAAIAKYDFWDPETGKAITDPVIFADTLHPPKRTGPARPRFYVPQTNQYHIHWGPEIQVVSPE